MTTFLILLAPLAVIAFAVVFRLRQIRRAVDAVDAHWHSLPASLKGDRND